MLASLTLAFCRRPALAGGVFAVGFAIKPHPIILVPLLALILWRHDRWRALARASLACATTLGLILGPWLVHGDARRIGSVYVTLFTKQRERLSELAWNVWWLPDQLGDPRPHSAAFGLVDLVSYQRLAFGLSAFAVLIAVSYALRHRDLISVFIAASYQAFAFYELPIGAHERYLYPLLVFMLPVALLRPSWLALYVPLSITFFLNLVIVAPPMARYMDRYVYAIWASSSPEYRRCSSSHSLPRCVGRPPGREKDRASAPSPWPGNADLEGPAPFRARVRSGGRHDANLVSGQPTSTDPLLSFELRRHTHLWLLWRVRRRALSRVPFRGDRSSA